MFLKLGLNNEKSIHTLPLQSIPLLLLHLYFLHLQTLPFVSLVSLITKTKRIAERSAIVTGCQDDRMTGRQDDRQRILDEYMIDY
jgi:hypothetical protein